jgi:hypothetical protein
MNDLPDVLERLTTRLDALEQRVLALEHPTDSAVVTPIVMSDAAPTLVANHESDQGFPVTVSGGIFPLLGKAMLGIAGAYLLRAVAESSSLPKVGVAAIAIAYALVWLVSASRAKAGEWLAGTVYACTSALILAPMLWELTLRFKVLPAPVTAAVVCGFVVAASALAWKRAFAPVLWVANATAAAIALPLSIASHQMTPFIAVLLVMVLICEWAAALERESGVRVLVALAADVAIWAQIYIYSGAETTRADYPALSSGWLLAPGLALFGLVGASVLYRTVLKGKQITVFETVQAMIAFLLAALGLITFGPAGSTFALGICCLVLAGAGYATAILRMNGSEEKRNALVFANWSGALLLAGSLMSLPQHWQGPWLGVMAVAATIAGTRLMWLTLEVHGVVFLVTASAISGLMNEIFSALAGTIAGRPGWSLLVVTACAIGCYSAMKPCETTARIRQAIAIVFAALAMGSIAALLVEGLVELIALKMIPGAHHLAFVRTFTACAATLALAFSGAHWRRMELTRIGYAALALVAVKLVFEDLRHGHLAFIAASIFLFALTLIVVPRVARIGHKT